MNVEIDYSTVLGQGRQGRVYQITRFNGTNRKDLIIKQYFDQRTVGKLKKFVDFINEKNLLSEPILECLPCLFYKNDKFIGVIMKKAKGISLENSYEELAKSPLSLRLKFCHDIARGIRILHESGMIHSDISDANVIKNKTTIRLIDVDGGGIIPKNIAPSIRGHGGGSWIAPEVFLDQQRLPDIRADEWSLAVLIHTILVPGIDPFYPLEKYFEIQNVTKWPIMKVKSKYHEIQEIQVAYLKACEPVHHLLTNTFTEGMRSSKQRINAGKFEETLVSCLQNVSICPHCREEIVSNNRGKCPFCGVSLVDVTLTIRGNTYQLNSRRLHITPEDFGLCGNISLASFELQNSKILCRLMKNTKARYSGRVFTQSELQPIATGQLTLIELLYMNRRLLLAIQEKNVPRKPEVIKINKNESGTGNTNGADNIIPLLGNIKSTGKKKGFWRRLFGF